MTLKIAGFAALSLTSFLGLSCLVLAQPNPFTNGCSSSSLVGTYGFSVNGVSIDGNLIAVVGQIHANGSGSLTGTETVSENGTISANLGVLGKYKINSDCTGTVGIQGAGRKIQNFDATITSGGKEVDMVETDNRTVELGTVRGGGSQACSTSQLKGAYALVGSGADIGVGVLAFSGQLRLHGDGTLDGTETISDNGSISTGLKVSGGYKVAKRCFGAAVINVGNQGPIHLNLFASPGGQEVFFIQIDNNTLVSGTWHK